MINRKNNIPALAFFALSFLACGCAPVSTTAPQPEHALSNGVLEAVGDAVLEVVVPKPETDSLKYEKPLPMDLIPYAVRQDKYYSIGTAFAISPSLFVSAAHVLPLGEGSQFTEAFLRGKDGKIYRIDKIVKYHRDRDFVIFTLRDWTGGGALKINTAPQLNQKVYAVGNALADGIVIRDGLYTSNTPEEEAGNWKWLRFSAAASPGNSGGPLLDGSGEVIGVVLRKSENENLNYALPIGEVMNTPENLAVLHFKLQYRIDNMDMTSLDTLHKELRLPMTYAELDKAETEAVAQFSGALLNKLLTENRADIFPNGKGSTALLNKSYNAVVPHIIMKDEDGNWDAFSVKDAVNSDLGSNGFLSYGRIGHTYYFYIQKPDAVPLEDFLGDSKLFMDLLLKGVYVYRQIGSEKIKIVSMNKARDEFPHTDSYGRKWTIRTWQQEYDDVQYAIASLPVPGGCIAMLRTGRTGQVATGHIPDLKVLADFIYVTYYGTFREWKEFLSLKDRLPSIFDTLDIRIENGGSFRFRSRRFAASYGPDLMSVTDKSDLSLRFTFFKDGESTVWDLDGIVIGDDQHNKISYSVYRYTKPPEELPDKVQSAWEDVAKQRFPYNRSVFQRDEYSSILTSIEADSPRKEKGPGSLFYTVGYTTQGKQEQPLMEKKLDGFLRNLKVFESSAGGAETGGKAQLRRPLPAGGDRGGKNSFTAVGFPGSGPNNHSLNGGR